VFGCRSQERLDSILRDPLELNGVAEVRPEEVHQGGSEDWVWSVTEVLFADLI
jgi:hypothetical protein